MRLSQVIQEVDALNPSYISNDVKTSFLNRVEGRILAEVMEVFEEKEITLENNVNIYELEGILHDYDIVKVFIGSTAIEKVDARTQHGNPYYFTIETDGILFIRFANCPLTGTAKVITQKRDAKLTYGVNANKELLIPYPYDSAYVHFLNAMIYHQGNDIDRYNQHLMLYNNEIKAFMIWYQNRKPKNNIKAKGWW